MQMLSISVGRVIDIQGRVWNAEYSNGPLNFLGYKNLIPDEGVPDEEDRPPLSQDYSLRFTSKDYFLTQEGEIYDFDRNEILDIPHKIERFIYIEDECFYLLTVEGVLLRADIDRISGPLEPRCSNGMREKYEYTQLHQDIAYLLGHNRFYHRDELLVIDNQGQWKEIRGLEYRYDDKKVGSVSYDHNTRTKLEEIVKVKDNYVIITDHIMSFTQPPDQQSPGSWDIDWIHMANAVDAIRVEDIINRIDHQVNLMIDNQGRLYSNWPDESTEIIECNNDMIINYNEEDQWIKFVNIFTNGLVGLVNNQGEVYQLSTQFLASSTDIPREIFAENMKYPKDEAQPTKCE